MGNPDTINPAIWIIWASALIIPCLVNLALWKKDHVLALHLKKSYKTSPSLFPNQPSPRISFLIAAWNEETAIDKCIQGIQHLPYSNIEIVICAGGEDNTYQVASRFANPRVIILEQIPGEGKQRSLKRCLQASTGEIIYLIDADCLLSTASFIYCIQPILDRREDVVTGSFYTPTPDQTKAFFIYIQMATRAYTAAHQPAYSQGLLGGNSAIRRDNLDRAGGFDNQVRTGTDYDLAKRLIGTGTRIRYEVFSTIESDFPITIKAYFRQQSRWIRNVVMHGIRYKAYREVFNNLLTSFSGCFMFTIPLIILSLVLSQRSLTFALHLLSAAWMTLLLYVLFSRVRYLKFTNIWPGKYSPNASIWFVLPFYICIDFIAWTLPLLEYPSKKFRHRW